MLFEVTGVLTLIADKFRIDNSSNINALNVRSLQISKILEYYSKSISLNLLEFRDLRAGASKAIMNIITNSLTLTESEFERITSNVSIFNITASVSANITTLSSNSIQIQT